MTIAYDMPAEQYHALPALSAGYCIRSEQECPAQAWWESPFNPDRPPPKEARELDIGTAAHLAILEPSEFAGRAILIPTDSFRSKSAQELRDQAIVEGKTPLLPKDYELVCRMAQVIEASEHRDWFYSRAGVGKSEVTLRWESPCGLVSPEFAAVDYLPCKARIDRLYTGADGKTVMLDLKTASSASAEAFQRAIVQNGHHIRAAWYKDGLAAAGKITGLGGGGGGEFVGGSAAYRFVVIGKAKPHLISVFELSERAEEWGRRRYRRAVREYLEGKASGEFRGHTTGTHMVDLPAREEYALADEEAEGRL